MEAYLGFARREFQRSIMYQLQFWAELGINLLFMYIYVCLWRTLYIGREAVAGYDRRHLLTYIIVSQTVLTFQFTVRTVSSIEGKVRSGEIALELMRPVDFQGMMLATAAGAVLHTLLFNIAPKFVLFALAGVVGPPVSPLALGLFVVSTVLGILILFGISFLIGVAAFWLVEVRGLYAAVMWGMATFLSGYFLPLEFYPGWLAPIARALPFQGMVYAPTVIYTGAAAGASAMPVLLGQLAWVVILIGGGRLLFRAAHRRLAVQGG
jgi:viologen exporter family transport system permease protein